MARRAIHGKSPPTPPVASSPPPMPKDQQRVFEEEQLLLFDETPYLALPPFARVGSQRWIQVAINRAPHLLLEALRTPLGLDDKAHIRWRSPLATEGFREYRDRVALHRLGIHLPPRSLSGWWPDGGPVWDGLGQVSDGQMLFLEAKAHIGEIFSPPTRATPDSLRIIERSLGEARQHYAPGSKASWSQMGFQLANRLAWHYFLRTVHGQPSHTVFLYFINCTEMRGPVSAQEWEKPIHYLHKRLGLPPNFHPPGVHSVFFDVSLLTEYAEIPAPLDPSVWQPTHNPWARGFVQQWPSSSR